MRKKTTPLFLHPFILFRNALVKDLRTNIESTNPESILSGNLEDFIDAGVKL